MSAKRQRRIVPIVLEQLGQNYYVQSVFNTYYPELWPWTPTLTWEGPNCTQLCGAQGPRCACPNVTTTEELDLAYWGIPDSLTYSSAFYSAAVKTTHLITYLVDDSLALTLNDSLLVYTTSQLSCNCQNIGKLKSSCHTCWPFMGCDFVGLPNASTSTALDAELPSSCLNLQAAVRFALWTFSVPYPQFPATPVLRTSLYPRYHRGMALSWIACFHLQRPATLFLQLPLARTHSRRIPSYKR